MFKLSRCSEDPCMARAICRAHNTHDMIHIRAGINLACSFLSQGQGLETQGQGRTTIERTTTRKGLHLQGQGKGPRT